MVISYFEEILEDFRDCSSKMEQLEIVLEKAQDLKGGDEVKLPQNKVHGCTSNVYVDCFLENGLLSFVGRSDALIVGGYIAIIFEGLKGLSVKDVLENKDFVYDFVKKAGIRESLTPTRANAFSNILEMIFAKIEKLR